MRSQEVGNMNRTVMNKEIESLAKSPMENKDQDMMALFLNCPKRLKKT